MSRVAKQFLLVGIAVAIGAFMLRFALDGGTPSIASGPEPTPTPVVDATPASTPTPAGTRDPATVPVLVANSTEVPGLAGATSTAIADGLGYQMLTPTDSTGPTLDLTTVFAVPGAEGDAQLIATDLRLSVTAVLPMPAQPPVVDLAGAEVLVVVGQDLAPEQ